MGIMSKPIPRLGHGVPMPKSIGEAIEMLAHAERYFEDAADRAFAMSRQLERASHCGNAYFHKDGMSYKNAAQHCRNALSVL
jgi:hypothetical protein